MTLACADQVVPPMPEAEGLTETLRGAPAVQGQAAAHVNGRPIPAAVVARQVQHGRPKAAVVNELVNAELFYERAIEQEYHQDPAVMQAYKRAMVDRYLASAVEDENRPEDVESSRVREYYQENQYLYYTPELRAADHLLVKPSSKKWAPDTNWDQVPEALFKTAAGFARDIKRDLVASGVEPRSAKELQVVQAKWSPRLPEDLEIVVERLPVSAQRSFGKPGMPGFINAMVDPFADAMFAMPGTGTVSEPVNTLFGTHLLVVTQIVPENRIPDAEAEAGIREYLSREDQTLAMATLMRRLIPKAVVRADESLLPKLESDGAQ